MLTDRQTPPKILIRGKKLGYVQQCLISKQQTYLLDVTQNGYGGREKHELAHTNYVWLTFDPRPITETQNRTRLRVILT